jgi:tRNA (cmo5U34)-methyltransferase
MQSNKDNQFFYAMSDAQEYDATIRLTVPYYDLIHKTLIDILKYHFGITINNIKPEDIEGFFLDLGAGTGMETISLLSEFPNLSALAVDIAPPMKVAFEENYKKIAKDNQKVRYNYIIDDIFNCDFTGSKDAEFKILGKKRLAAISSYCIHHFVYEDKIKVYQKMYDFLDKGGIMINVDLFNYESEVFSQYAHHFDIEYIKKEFDDPCPEYVESKKMSVSQRQRLKLEWVKHMEEDNILDTIEAQIEGLKNIGFKNVECIFKYFQQGIIVATK